MTMPVLISVDWGTTALRCCAVAADGYVLETRDGGPGILAVEQGRFAEALDNEIARWSPAGAALPVLMSGMIGSRQGWLEVRYLPCPATPLGLAEGLTAVPVWTGGACHIVPGLVMQRPGEPPDVMRGEETQIIGALAASLQTNGLFVLPGTHSKWAAVTGGAITSFETYMTGEMFAALRHHTILARLMPEGHSPFDPAAFDRGVASGAADGPPGALLHRLFSTRTLGLFDHLLPAALESYLSGLLIGAELAAATRTADAKSFTIIGSVLLSDRYQRAARQLNLNATTAPADCAARGHYAVAKTAGLLKASAR